MTAPLFLPGVPEAYVRNRLAQAGGDEIGSGKFAHPESSAALAANAFGWFVQRPELLPSLPGAAHAGTALRVELEYCARFPWAAGRHPWLDASIFTASHIVGVESKRFEPFRDAKRPSFSASYDRPVWGADMSKFCAVRDRLRERTLHFAHLDAAQLVKHAYGLVTEGRRLGLAPMLFYIHAEPTRRGGQVIPTEDIERHQAEIAAFASLVAGDEVTFAACSYRDWLMGAVGQAVAHAAALTARYDL